MTYKRKLDGAEGPVDVFLVGWKRRYDDLIVRASFELDASGQERLKADAAYLTREWDEYNASTGSLM